MKTIMVPVLVPKPQILGGGGVPLLIGFNEEGDISVLAIELPAGLTLTSIGRIDVQLDGEGENLMGEVPLDLFGKPLTLRFRKRR